MFDTEADKLMRQAPKTIANYLDDCIQILDERFGEGYAKNNPELLGQMVEACAQDFGGMYVSTHLGYIADRLSSVSDALDN